MKDELQRPLQDLADALHHAIETSPEVERALAALRASGFGASLLLEVTVALSREASDPDALETDADADFLRSLRISID